jgi:hypothetical protein
MSAPNYLTLLYESAKGKHAELEAIPPGALAELDERLSLRNRRTRTADIVLLSILLTIAYFGVAVGIAVSLRFVGSVSKRLAGYDYAQAIVSVPGLRIGLMFGIFAALAYFLFAPLWKMTSKEERISFLFADWTEKQFLIASVVSLYLTFGAAIVLVGSLVSNSRSLLETLFYIWLVPLGLLLAFAPFGIPAVGMLLQRNLRNKATTNDLQVTEQLLSLLDDWPRLLNRGDDDCKRDVARRIKTIAETIRRLYFKTPSDRSEEWSAEQMQRAADNLLVCVSWLYVPQAATIESIRLRLVTFCNAFLTGTLHNLPRNELTELDGFKLPRRRQRIMRTVSMTLAILTYLLLPLVIYFLLRSRVQQLSVPESFLILLYSLWIAVGLYAYLEQTSQSGMATIIDLIKGIVGK